MYIPNAIATRLSVSELKSSFQQVSGIGWLLLLWGLLGLVLLVDLTPNYQRLDVGMVSPFDVRTPERLTYESAIRTERERDRAASGVEPIYFPPDRSQAMRQTATAQEMSRFLDAVRSNPYADREAKLAHIAALQPLQFQDEVAEMILELPEEQWQAVIAETSRMVDTQMRGEIRESRLPAILRTLSNQISTSLSDRQAEVVVAWAGGLITTNTFLDSERTEQARLAAREAVLPIESTYEAGQIVVREGEIITSEQVEALQELGLHQPARSWVHLLTTVFFLLYVVGVLGLYLLRLHPEYFSSPRIMTMITIFLVTMVWGVRVVMPESQQLSYLLPTAMVPMLLGVLLGLDLATITTVALALVVGYVTNSIEMVVYTFLGGLIAALVLWRVERLGTFVWTGALVGLSNVGIILVFRLPETNLDLTFLAFACGMGLLNGMASASLALVGFYILSGLLGVTTFLQLMELGRPTHPLLRDLLMKAPGTYHHSMVVSNLAEGAAQVVGADMLLVRIGAYYHDIGKTISPEYFVENQADGVNLHNGLNDPYKSASIILGHVTEGIKLGQRHKLPREMIDFIAQHHGTTKVAWFYHKACQQDGEENVNEEDFCYIGPKPQSRESAILMLADTVEATSRAVKPDTAQKIDDLIRKTIANKLSDGQFDECDINLRDLELIRQAFLKVLQGIYHPRIAYPPKEKKDSPKVLPAGDLPRLAAPSPAPALQAPKEGVYSHEGTHSHRDTDPTPVGSTS